MAQPPLTVARVQERLNEIRLLAHAKDPEAAHGREDSLYVDVLRAVVAGHPEARALAVEALKARRIPFARWTG